jgi:hypothetical protein
MGMVNNFDLGVFIKSFGSSIYIETGTGTGKCLSHALKYNFEKNYSIDLDEGLIKEAQKIFKDYNVEFINDFSSKALDELIPTLPKDKNIFFWLDAHYPEADFRGLTHMQSVEKYTTDECFPLLKEIRIIKEHRDISKDCFILDDWMNYDRKLEYATPILTEKTTCPQHKEPILSEFRGTHNCKALFSNQGYLIALPKQFETSPCYIYF